MIHKNRALLVIKYLWEHTDEKHPAVTNDILDHLASLGLPTTRKTLAGDIAELQDTGFDIVCSRSRQNEYFIGSRMLELIELKLLADAVQAARFISPRKSSELIGKISSLASSHQSSELKRNLFVDGKPKTGNEKVYYTIDMAAQTTPKTVRVIPPKPEFSGENRIDIRPKRVAAYCRVSTDKEQQDHSFETQKAMYTDMIMIKPNWQMAGVYADAGITGTIAKKRPDFMRMIEDCRKGKIDLIITKSVSRFSRNNLDCLLYVRELKEMGIPIIFEKEGINTMQVSSELLITLFSGLSQAESESISMNVRIGKRQSLKNGNVPFSYSSFLGYRKGADGMPEIDEEQAVTIRRIFAEYLAGKSLKDIADGLTANGIPTARGNPRWSSERVLSILTNEKYKGDALLQKTYVVDCISKKTKKNNGELPMYYVENNHPAIIERVVFDRVQEEIARRNSKRKVKQTGTKTELGKYSGKYALSEILCCGNCGTPYRRCTWSKNGKKKVVWRCISRLDYGTKYCKDSPSIEESVLQNAIAEAITKKAQMENTGIDRFRQHIELYQSRQDTGSILAKQERLRAIQAHIDQLTNMDSEAAQNGDFDAQFESLYAEMYTIKDELAEAEKAKSKLETAAGSLEEMTAVMEGMKNHPVEYSDLAVRQLIECIKVMSADLLYICFKDGTRIEANL